MVSTSMPSVGVLSVSSVSIAQRKYVHVQCVSMVSAGTFGAPAPVRRKKIRQEPWSARKEGRLNL